MFKGIKAVIFDLDGTLIDSMWLWKTLDQDYLTRFGHELTDDIPEAIEGMSFTESAQFFKNHFQLEDDIETIKNDWHEMAKGYYLNDVTLKPGVLELLNDLRAKDIKIGIATSNLRPIVDQVLGRFAITDYFGSVRTSCEVAQGKPAPDVYLQVAKDLGVAPEYCLVFEDVLNGVKGGKHAGMQVCAVYDDFSKPMTELIREEAHYYIEDFKVVVVG